MFLFFIILFFEKNDEYFLDTDVTSGFMMFLVSYALELVKLMDQDPKSDAVQAVVARHHLLIQKFYDCPLPMYRGLGKMYVEDSRFTAFYDKHKAGLARFLCDAIAHYCDVREKI